MNGVVIVDTDVVSFLFKGDTRAEAYRQHLQSKMLAVSFMTVAELYQWAYIRNWGDRKRAHIKLGGAPYVAPLRCRFHSFVPENGSERRRKTYETVQLLARFQLVMRPIRFVSIT